jgi:hypothetical protein
MGPNFEIGGGTEIGRGGTKKPRPSVFVRVLEVAGLVLVAYGLGTSRFVLAALGGGVIFLSYVVYRRKHGPFQQNGSDSDRSGTDTDGGSD